MKWVRILMKVGRKLSSYRDFFQEPYITGIMRSVFMRWQMLWAKTSCGFVHAPAANNKIVLNAKTLSMQGRPLKSFRKKGQKAWRVPQTIIVINGAFLLALQESPALHGGRGSFVLHIHFGQNSFPHIGHS
jgi:hypothetical protein